MKRLIILLCLAGCSQTENPENDLGIAWARSAAEYEALALQAYGEATRDLPVLLADSAFSALPSQIDAKDLPPAIILDVDETVVSHADFQLTYERPFTNAKLDRWNQENPARPIPGASGFVAAAREAGVEVFFVTNRPCEPTEDSACPQKDTTLTDLKEAGIDVSPDRLWLAFEKPEWTKEKRVRRDAVAENHRVIMLFGDDLGDFLPCVRAKPAMPCTNSASRESRAAGVRAHSQYFGHGWYVLPNPMHGSWTALTKP